MLPYAGAASSESAVSGMEGVSDGTPSLPFPNCLHKVCRNEKAAVNFRYSMTLKQDGIGQALSNGLRLTSDATFEREKAEEAERASYRRTYWQGYAKKVKRIFGTVTPDEHDAVKQRAEDAGRSVWGQVWAESQAYSAERTLATGEIAEQQRALVSELRRIGNNLNQLARLGHIRNRKHGLTSKNDDALGDEAMKQLALLEDVVTKFDDGMTIRTRS